MNSRSSSGRLLSGFYKLIDKATAQQIKDAADIVEVVGDYVRLIRRGANYMGLCPFHNERTPSFSVNKAKNFCYCFSCHKGGSPVNFIMEKEGLSYHDALMHLANKYGIRVEEKELTDEERIAQNEREAMLVANEWAMKKMENDLHSTEEGQNIGLQYFYQRGVTEEAMKEFHLGYALDQGWALTNAARKDGIALDVLKTLGLVGTSQQGREYDRFRGRVIFPIINSSGKVIAFGGRDLKGGIAKYINSPESALYKKNIELYGIFQARSSIMKEDRCFLVEGYMDVIGMWQSGLKNVVASSGTALTDGQINLIHRFTNNVTLIYDGDAAGIKASLRGIDMLLSHGLNVKVLLLPDGHDPDSFARRNSSEQFREYVAQHETDILRFKARVLMQSASDDPQKRVEAIKSMVTSLACISDKIKLDVYIQQCSELLNMPEETISFAVKEEQQRRSLQENRQYAKQSVSPATPLQSDATGGERVGVAGNTTTVNDAATSKKVNNLFPFEKNIISYCVKYGFMKKIECFDGDGQTYFISVLDFIEEEMANDNMTFSFPLFNTIFSLLIKMRDEFRTSLDAKQIDIEQEAQRRRGEGYDAIAERGLSVAEIDKEEKKLEENINAFIAESLDDFSRAYPSKELASCEDDGVRRIVTELISEKHQLSHIYMRDNMKPEREEDRLGALVSRAIMEWRYEIVNTKLKEMFQLLGEAVEKGDVESEHSLQQNISNLMYYRSQMAKDIGDRILYTSMRN